MVFISVFDMHEKYKVLGCLAIEKPSSWYFLGHYMKLCMKVEDNSCFPAPLMSDHPSFMTFFFFFSDGLVLFCEVPLISRKPSNMTNKQQLCQIQEPKMGFISQKIIQLSHCRNDSEVFQYLEITRNFCSILNACLCETVERVDVMNDNQTKQNSCSNHSTLKKVERENKNIRLFIIIIIIIYPLTMRVVGAPQMILQPVSSIFPCSPLPSGTWQTPGLSIPWCCLPTSSTICLVFFPLSLCLVRWFWPDLMKRRHDHTTAVCISLQWSGGLRVVRLPAGSWHGLPCW